MKQKAFFIIFEILFFLVKKKVSIKTTKRKEEVSLHDYMVQKVNDIKLNYGGMLSSCFILWFE